jgi:transcriptional regulator with XRE-family HTH domain
MRVSNKDDFGPYLAMLREKQGFATQRKLALAANVNVATISRIEAGLQKVKPETLKKLAPLLNVPLKGLMEKAGYLDSAPTPSPVHSPEDEIRFNLRDLFPNETIHIYNLDSMSVEKKERLKTAIKDFGIPFVTIADAVKMQMLTTDVLDPSNDLETAMNRIEQVAELMKKTLTDLTLLVFEGLPQNEVALARMLIVLDKTVELTKKGIIRRVALQKLAASAAGDLEVSL